MFKSLVIVGSILVAAMPWLSGGRDHIWILVSAFSLLIGAYLILTRPGRKTVATKALVVSLVVWIGWAVASLIWTVNQYQTWTWILFALMVVTVGLLTANLNQKEKGMLLTGYLWLASITGAIGIFIYLTAEYGRLTSTFYWANPAATFFIPAILIGTARWLKNKRPADLLITGVTLVSFWLADSRGAMLVLLLTVIALLLTVPNVRKFWLRLLLFVLTPYVIAFGFVQLKNNLVHSDFIGPGSRFKEAAMGESQSGKDRLNYLESAASIWWDNPVAGTGAGTFGTVHPQYQKKVVSASNDPHNFYIQTLAELGIIGAIALSWVIFLVLIGVARGYARDKHMGMVAVSVVAIFLNLGLDIGGRYPAILALLAILIGLSYEPWTRRPIKPNDNILPGVMLAALLVISVTNYQSSMWRERGKIYDDNRELDRAAQSYNKAQAMFISDPDNFNSEGIDYFAQATVDSKERKAKLAQARDKANQAIEADPQDGQHYFLLGRVEYLDKNYAAAEDAYKKALELDQYNHAEYYQDLASLQITRENRQAAQATVDRALVLYTDDVINNRNQDVSIRVAVSQLLVFKAAEQNLQGDKEASKQTLDRALKLNPVNMNAIKLRSRL